MVWVKCIYRCHHRGPLVFHSLNIAQYSSNDCNVAWLLKPLFLKTRSISIEVIIALIARPPADELLVEGSVCGK